MKLLKKPIYFILIKHTSSNLITVMQKKNTLFKVYLYIWFLL